ncbi:hypothetical protein [Bacillus velezensis]|uniref:hypothetical protein n=1 Tax=Bacillus TaxID=1386 RepID=UPI00025B1774|nr:hypothetical protein MY7_0043 [Bacillus sp. 5B6]QNE09306.1 hypothetical protein H5405_17955 [Bacillus velezensis]SIR73204.1 hydrophobic/amphiphilic exporter-1, HAE1 family [Bacillus amyloliquefaciens]
MSWLTKWSFANKAAITLTSIIIIAWGVVSYLRILVKKSESVNLVSQSLAVVVIGGLAVATMLTLIVIPCVYEIFNFKKSKMQRLEKTLKDDITI